MIGIDALLGKTLTRAEVRNEDTEITFEAEDGSCFLMYHYQDCCESVYVESVVGDLSDLIGSPILQAEEVVQMSGDDASLEGRGDESFTWTFYKLATIKGSVTIRWYGGSNGYYSESVTFKQLEAA
jgi:hypothetical protein